MDLSGGDLSGGDYVCTVLISLELKGGWGGRRRKERGGGREREGRGEARTMESF